MMSFLISAHLFHRKPDFSITFLFLNQLSLNLVPGFKIGYWFFFIFLPQKVAKGRFQTTRHKTHQFTSLFGQTPLRNSIAMATSKIPVDQKLFERMCFMLKLKVTKFQLSTRNDFWAVLKTVGWNSSPTLIQNRVKTSLYNDAEWDKNKIYQRMTSLWRLWRHLCSVEHRILLKTVYIKIGFACSSFVWSYSNLAETSSTNAAFAWKIKFQLIVVSLVLMTSST